MGKLQSKCAAKRRQNPEGDSVASTALSGHREPEQSHKTKLTENLSAEVRKNKSDHICDLQVVLPPKKTAVWKKSVHDDKETSTKRSNEPKWDVVSEKDSQQEWTFTLYNPDPHGSSKEMSTLIQSIYELLEASVTQPRFDNTPLKIKLAVTSSVGHDKTLQTAAKEHGASVEAGSPARKVYSADENIERRNHYLDLAGVENYASKFDNADPLGQEPQQQPPSVFQHHTVAGKQRCTSFRSPASPSVPRSAARERNRGVSRSCRFHGHHSASWSPPAAGQSVPQQSHQKRLRSRTQDAHAPVRRPSFQLQPGENKRLNPSCGTPTARPHEHLHHHEHHHHHHHHHHYHPS